jgi:hypothetical protein
MPHRSGSLIPEKSGTPRKKKKKEKKRKMRTPIDISNVPF